MYYLRIFIYEVLLLIIAGLGIWGGWYILSVNTIDLNCISIFLLLGIAYLEIRIVIWCLDILIEPHEIFGCKFPKEKSRLNPCQEYQDCEICKRREIFGSHTMKDFLRSEEHPCRKCQKCEVCGMEILSDISHDFEEYIRDSRGPCSWVKQCKVCGQKDFAVFHDFPQASWECTAKSNCTRCGVEGENYSDHDYLYESGYDVWICSRCGCYRS